MTILERTRLHVGSRMALATPMFHGLGFGMLTLTIGLGGTVLTRRRFDAEAALAQASLHRADALSAVPVMLARILDLPQRVRARNPVPCLRVVISSGDRLDPGLARRFMDTYGDILYNLYGSTEVGIGSWPRQPTCGSPRKRWAGPLRAARSAFSTATAGPSVRGSPGASSSEAN
ncbi:hypothetical protein NIIDMKKI_73870 [Mycobacterium kansasii]|uniref:AMP-dependent synthetase/ligase domain-containing protein n=1 Tax=Mycobacterium kansasii TaxID=1768 RepID=A0A7G1IMK3_MYCKA|nr:hypothetical protein NIIDMKKI_73870 [Mycobacterium kansasii]